MFSCRIKSKDDNKIYWAMFASTLEEIERDLKRDAWMFQYNDVLTIRQGRKTIRRDTIPVSFHGWNTQRNKHRGLKIT